MKPRIDATEFGSITVEGLFYVKSRSVLARFCSDRLGRSWALGDENRGV